MKSLISTLSLILITSISVAQSPYFEWARQFKGAFYSTTIRTDAFDNVYTFGNFTGKIDIDPDSTVQEISSAGGADMFLSKLDPNGHLIWGRTIGGTGLESAISMMVDSIGNTYLHGFFNDSVDFNPNPTADTILHVSNGGYFLLKLDSAGEFEWVAQYPLWSGNRDYNQRIGFDASGNIIFTGQFRGSVDFDPGPSQFILNNPISSISNSFICKLKPDGSFVWAKQLTGGNNFGKSVQADKNGNIYVIGEFWDSTDFDPDTTLYYLFTENFISRYLLKLNSNGQLVWAKQFSDTNGSIEIYNLDVNGKDEILLTGDFRKSPDFDPDTSTARLTSDGFSDIFVLKLDNQGGFTWVKKIGGTETDYGSSISCDEQDNVWVTGSFKEKVDFDPGSGVFELEAVQDLFLLKLDDNGEFLWAGSIGHNGNDVGTSIYSGLNDDLYVCGWFYFNPDFDPGPGEYILNAGSSLSNPAVFNLKLKGGVVGVNETVTKQQEYSIFPNPSDGIVTLILNDQDENHLIRLFNQQGQLLDTYNSNYRNQLELSLPGSSGFYFIQMISDQGSEVFKVVRK